MTNPIPEALPLQLLRTIDPVCDAFDLAFKEGRRLVIEEQLDSVVETVRPLLLVELIRTELEWRYRLGETPAAAEYCQRFPGCASTVDHWLAEARTAAEQIASGGAETDGPEFPRTSTFVGQAAGLPFPDRPTAFPTSLGEYDLLDKLGAGGMGEVYQARHRRLGKLVALKVLPDRARGSTENVTRFLREMKAVGNLDHPNVIEAHDAGEQDGIVYLVMKLIEGEDLARLVRRHGPLPLAEACDCGRQVALGLHYLHERGLVHRDLKPSNLMRLRDGTVKILDLGLARWCVEAAPDGELTQRGQIMGTPDYLAPEQIGGAAGADIRADLYALGGTLFFLLTGRAPFAHHADQQGKLQAHLAEVPPDVRTLRPEVPAALAELVQRLLAKNPADRPQTPSEVAAALADPERQGKEDTPLRPAAGRRKRWQAVGVGLLAVVLLVATVAFLRRGHVEDRAASPAGGTVAGEDRVEILSLDVKHYATVTRDGQRGAEPRGLLGKDSFDTRLDDSVTMEARLSRPGYAYLIVFRPDGTEDVCFPEKEDTVPPRTERPRYPSVSRAVNYGLTDGEGLEVFALVVSSRPLPSYKEWHKRRSASPWKKSPAPPGIVWYDDGNFVESLTADGRNRGSRGKGQEVAGKSQVVAVLDWLRQAPEVEAVAGVGFAVLPGVKP